MFGELLGQLGAGYSAYQGGRQQQAAQNWEREQKREERVRRNALDQALMDLREAQTARAERPDDPAARYDPATDIPTQRRKHFIEQGWMQDPNDPDEEEAYDPATDPVLQRRRAGLAEGLYAKPGSGDAESQRSDREWKAVQAEEIAVKTIQRYGNDVEKAIAYWMQQDVVFGHPEARAVIKALQSKRPRPGSTPGFDFDLTKVKPLPPGR